MKLSSLIDNRCARHNLRRMVRTVELKSRAMLPQAGKGQVVGLLGGSFDPAHGGHLHVSLQALKRLGLDMVWWLISPGNPLKVRGPASIADRMDIARSLIKHPRIKVTDIEHLLGTRYTCETLDSVMELYPHVRFVWLMGADNLVEFHKWQDWRSIMLHVPVAVFARPGFGMGALNSPAARTFAQSRIGHKNAATLAMSDPPAWTYLPIPLDDRSSSEIRANA